MHRFETERCIFSFLTKNFDCRKKAVDRIAKTCIIFETPKTERIYLI
jgi:hypothetical protein